MKLPLANNAVPGTISRPSPLEKTINALAYLFYYPKIQVDSRHRSVTILDGPGGLGAFLTEALVALCYTTRGYRTVWEHQNYALNPSTGHVERINIAHKSL